MKATSRDDQASNRYDQKQSFVSGKIKVMTIYHKPYNLVNTFYQNFTIMFFILYYGKAIKHESILTPPLGGVSR
jgi:hypothetical protein